VHRSRKTEGNQPGGIARQPYRLQARIRLGTVNQRPAAVALLEQAPLMGVQAEAMLLEFLAPAPRQRQYDGSGLLRLAPRTGRDLGRRRARS